MADGGIARWRITCIEYPYKRIRFIIIWRLKRFGGITGGGLTNIHCSTFVERVYELFILYFLVINKCTQSLF